MARTKIAKLRVMKRKARQRSSAQQRIEIEVLVDQNSESPVQSLNFQHGSQSWLDRSPITMVSIDCLAAIIEAKQLPSPTPLFHFFSTSQSSQSILFVHGGNLSLFTLREQLQAALCRILFTIEGTL